MDVQENDEIVDTSIVKAEMKDCDRRNELVGLIYHLFIQFLNPLMH